MQLDQFHSEVERIKKGGSPKAHEKNTEAGKLFARERIHLLVDEGSFVEDGLFANALHKDLPADGVITGTATVDGRPVALMANDSTIKAGSWGARTVEKIIRIQEVALRMKIPMLYLVDSAGARITDQLDMFPGRRHAGTIFHMEVALSGLVPQVCLLFGPSAAGGAYIPAFCDVVMMVEGNASMYLGSPRMAEMVIGEKISLEDLGGARMHCSVSGCGDFLCKTEVGGHRPLPPVPGLLPAALRRRAAHGPVEGGLSQSESFGRPGADGHHGPLPDEGLHRGPGGRGQLPGGEEALSPARSSRAWRGWTASPWASSPTSPG